MAPCGDLLADEGNRLTAALHEEHAGEGTDVLVVRIERVNECTPG
jgi:hypothetical protein